MKFNQTVPSAPQNSLESLRNENAALLSLHTTAVPRNHSLHALSIQLIDSIIGDVTFITNRPFSNSKFN